MNNQDWDSGMEALLVEELNSNGHVHVLRLKERATEKGLANPGHFNRLGGLMGGWVRKHKLVPTGDKVQAPKHAHKRPVAVWKRGPAAGTPEPQAGSESGT